MNRIFPCLMLVSIVFFVCQESEAGEPTQPSITAIVKADVLRVRSAPSTDAQIIAKIPQNTTVQIVESLPSMSPWVRITIPSKKSTGWVHGDFLLIDGDGEKTNSNNDIQFVRVSSWLNNIVVDWFEPPESLLRNLSHGVHGRFTVGTPFTVIAKNLESTAAATASTNSDVGLRSAFDSTPMTEISLKDQDDRFCVQPYLAIVGNVKGYKPIRGTEINDPNKIVELVKRLKREMPDFYSLPYRPEDPGYDETCFSEKNTKVSVSSLPLDNTPAWLLNYATLYTGYQSSPEAKYFFRVSVLLWKGKPFYCATYTADGLEFFLIGERIFCWMNVAAYEKGIRYVIVYELDADSGEAIEVYYNNDFSS